MQSLPQVARIDVGRGGLQRLILSGAEGEAHLYTHGAHIVHFQPRGERPVLMMSRAAEFAAGAPGRPIRGGVPICFPWFGPKAGDATAPPHGVARLLTWTVESISVVEDGRLRAALTLCSDAYTQRLFPDEFALGFTVTVGRSLDMALTVRNQGRAPLCFEEALHSYFSVSDVRQVAITGLEKVAFIDKADGFARKLAGDEPLVIRAETDRVFLGTRSTVTLTDPAWRRSIIVEKAGSNTTIVWNPWAEKARTIPDLADEDWWEMVCIETANAADDAVTLAPGATHVVTVTISTRPIAAA
jgi:glucose-6-phosphate 1-epimerase